MTSVNSPACLLARNRFYRNSDSSPEPEQLKPEFTSVRRKRRQVSLCVAMTTPPGGGGSRGLWVHVVLGSSSSLHFSTSRPTRPAYRGIK